MRRDDALLLDMLIAARKIRRYTENMNFAQFNANEMAQSAVIRELQVIGEAARLVTAELQQAHAALDWHAIIGMRNRLIHGYFAIRLDVVWKTVQDDVQPLIARLETLIPPEEDKSNE
jgi:uncharacterized protein with HEPN domain